jgi:ATP-dependent Clp protease adapter protein ClpS
MLQQLYKNQNETEKRNTELTIIQSSNGHTAIKDLDSDKNLIRQFTVKEFIKFLQIDEQNARSTFVDVHTTTSRHIR